MKTKILFFSSLLAVGTLLNSCSLEDQLEKATETPVDISMPFEQDIDAVPNFTNAVHLERKIVPNLDSVLKANGAGRFTSKNITKAVLKSVQFEILTPATANFDPFGFTEVGFTRSNQTSDYRFYSVSGPDLPSSTRSVLLPVLQNEPTPPMPYLTHAIGADQDLINFLKAPSLTCRLLMFPNTGFTSLPAMKMRFILTFTVTATL